LGFVKAKISIKLIIGNVNKIKGGKNIDL